ncbi:MAG: DnaJ domain-containing protein, partial [Thermoguttaceae bacterium]|nr:DnaJ domain-containing protein [Thermoguttaceae bacterium]
MAEEVDYYEILGIERTASEKEISTAYRKAAMKYHPDRNPGDEEAVAKFKLCAEAFEVLNDKEKRSVYDRYGKAGLDGAGVGGGFQDVGDI